MTVIIPYPNTLNESSVKYVNILLTHWIKCHHETKWKTKKNQPHLSNSGGVRRRPSQTASKVKILPRHITMRWEGHEPSPSKHRDHTAHLLPFTMHTRTHTRSSVLWDKQYLRLRCFSSNLHCGEKRRKKNPKHFLDFKQTKLLSN